MRMRKAVVLFLHNLDCLGGQARQPNVASTPTHLSVCRCNKCASGDAATGVLLLCVLFTPSTPLFFAFSLPPPRVTCVGTSLRTFW